MVYYLFFLQTTLSKSVMYSVASTCALQLADTIPFAMLTAPCHRWEFLSTLDFEWEVFTGKRPWKWSFTVYLLARLLALMAILCELVGFNLTSVFNCNVGIRSGIPLFSTDRPNLAAGLVPFYPFWVVVRSGCCLVPSRTSWVNEP